MTDSNHVQLTQACSITSSNTSNNTTKYFYSSQINNNEFACLNKVCCSV